MTHDFETNRISYHEIETRARQMRAEAVRAQAKSFGTWLQSALNGQAFARRGNA